MTSKNKIALVFSAAAVLLLIGFGLALRSYDSYDVLTSQQRENLASSHFETLGTSCIEYTNDGASCMDADGNWVWNQSYEMEDPQMEKSGDYLLIYEQNGTEAYLMTAEKIQVRIEAESPIVAAGLASSGATALLMRQDEEYLLALYDRNGSKIAGGEYYESQGKIPVNLVLSDKGDKLVIDTVDISDGSMDATLDIYRFAEEPGDSSPVESVTLDDRMIADILFLGEDTLAALTDQSLCLYEVSAEETTQKKEIAFDQTPASVFYSADEIGLIAPRDDDSGTSRITVYNSRGDVVMEYASGVLFHTAKILENGEICVFSDTACEIYTKHSIRKFSCEFDKSLYDVQYLGSGNCYRFVMEGAVERVKLQ